MSLYTQELTALLKWYRSLGAEILFYPIQDSLGANVEKIVREPHKTKSVRTIVPKTVSVQSDMSDGRDFADLCNGIAQLDCPLKRTARSTVIYDGNIDAKVMLIGEAPGYDEDLQGKPFVGRSGNLLNKMLASIDLSRNDVFITNTVFWRPPGNRNPAQEEILLCLPFVKRLVKMVSPKVIMLLGSIATHALLDTMQPITKLRGRVNNFMGINTIPTYHPAYLLRNPNQKRQAYNDLLLLKQTLNGNG